MKNDLRRAYEEALSTGDLKHTTQRKRILDRILASREHVTAEGLLDALRGEGAKVSRATVYRTLAFLKSRHLIEEHDFGRGTKYYEPILGRKHHDHLFCLGCGKIEEFEDDAIEAHQDRIYKRTGFTPVSHSMKLFGYCRGCGPGRKPAH